MGSDGLSIVVINIIIGAVLLLFGRNSFWLFVGCIGFAVGLQYAPLLLDIKSPVILADPQDWQRIEPQDVLVLDTLRADLQNGHQLSILNRTRHQSYPLTHALSGRQLQVLLAGGLINFIRQRG